jgi:hypothetical protein
MGSIDARIRLHSLLHVSRKGRDSNHVRRTASDQWRSGVHRLVIAFERSVSFTPTEREEKR